MSTNQSNNLRPCPFCGSKALTNIFLDYEDIENPPTEVTCENERCIYGWWLSPKDWNTRPIEDKLQSRIAELEAARRWRVVADGELPEHDGEYWVWLEAWNTPHKRGACIYSKDYHDNNGFFNLIPVTHWMPLPEPPEERER